MGPILAKLKKETAATDSHHLSTALIENLSSLNPEFSAVFPLPEDLITEILVHLPVKSLVKFKCVSKRWLSLISSPQFIKSHFSTSSKDGQYSNHLLLFKTSAPNSCMKQCSLSSALYEPSSSTHVSDIGYPSQNHREGSLRIVGIINGLVCLAITYVKHLYLWNPILKQSKRLPSSEPSPTGWVVYGFGYDESNDDYKVVKLSWVWGEVVHKTDVQVYSLRADSWRRIEGFKGGRNVPLYDGKFVNGKMLWTANTCFGSSEKWKIVSLDMVSDKYVEVQGPNYEAGAFYCGIGSFGGSLSMLCEYIRRKADLWVMDKNGVENSWSKVFSFPYDDVHHPRAESHFLKKVVCILGDGEVVLEDRPGELIVYHTKKKEFRNIRLDGLYLGFFVYVESLVPS